MNAEGFVTIKGVDYAIGTLDAMKQFHVARRLAPLLAGMVGTFGPAPEEKPADAPETQIPKEPMDLAPLAAALAEMDDKTSEYIILTCLAVVKKKDGGAWCAMVSRGRLMYDNLDLATMIELTVEVVKENLTNFFPGAPATSPAATK
jgi:hypothetical protein